MRIEVSKDAGVITAAMGIPSIVTHGGRAHAEEASTKSVPHGAKEALFHDFLDPLMESLANVARRKGFFWFRHPEECAKWPPALMWVVFEEISP